MKSVRPSMLKSPTALTNPHVPELTLIAACNVPSPFPNRITEPLPETATSSLPSPLKSPMNKDSGEMPITKLIPAWNVPSPFPRYMVTVFAARSAIARSCLPSALKSPLTMEIGPVPTVKVFAV